MKPSSLNFIIICNFLVFSIESAFAQGFSSGSDGSYGAIDLTSGNATLNVPANGVFNCTTINIPVNKQLTFAKNAANTPVYLLATGDVTFGSNATIYIAGSGPTNKRGGAGGPGGFDGGQGGTTPGNGYGPGGGKGGWTDAGLTPPAGKAVRGSGGYRSAGLGATTGGLAYGNSLLIPLVGGSGGGGSEHTNDGSQYGGGGGGGAILIASSTKIVFSSGSYIYAFGGSSGYSTQGGGSGGAVHLIAPTVSGTVDANVLPNGGGNQPEGVGRVRVDALNSSITFTGTSAQYATFGANMVVFPTNLPEIHVTQVGTQTIPATQTDPVFVLLPSGTPATQTIQVQVKNFSTVVPLVAVITPEAGDRTTFNFDVDNTAGGATTGSVQVQIPAGVSTRIDVWTR